MHTYFNKFSLFSISLFLVFFSCEEKSGNIKENTFELQGTLTEIPDQTWIYLKDDAGNIDSTQLVNGKFSFTGTIPHPSRFTLRTMKPFNYSGIWLEEGKVTYEGKNEEFKKGKVTGSNSHQDYEALRDLTRDYVERRDSLTRIVRFSEGTEEQIAEANKGLQEIYANHLKLEKKFIRENPDSYVSIYLVDFYSRSFGKKNTTELYATINEELKKSTYGKSIERFFDININPKVGDQYVDFALADASGKKVNLSDYEGKLILLDFWASWCGPCIEEYPALKEAYAKFHDKGLEIVSVSSDNSEKAWLRAIEKNELKWINLWEESGDNADPFIIYGVNGIPDNFLIDQNGKIIAQNLRGDDLISTIEKQIVAL